MSNSTTIYIFSEDKELKDWADLFAKNLALICNQLLKSNETIKIESFNGKLSKSNNHVFLLTKESNSKLSISDTEKGKSNIFQIHLSPIPFQNIPLFLQEVPVFEFYDTDPISNNSTWSDLNVTTGNIWEKLLDFTKSIFNLYKKDKQTIYLARTSINQNPNRDKLKRDFLNQGYKVIPEAPLNTSSVKDLEKQITSLISDAFLSVHIYGNDSVEDGNQNIELVEFQNKICAKNNTTDFYRLIWLPSDAKLDKENEEKISLLRKDLELLKGAEFVEAPLELFKSLIYQKIDSISSQKKVIKNGLYFIYDNKESKEVQQIKSEIQKNKLNVLEVNNFEDHPLINHKSNLNNSNGVIIYYDGSNNKWIENILNDIIKAPKYRNNKKSNAIGIVSNSDLILKPELKSYKLEKIDIADQSQLKSFIQNINK